MLTMDNCSSIKLTIVIFRPQVRPNLSAAGTVIIYMQPWRSDPQDLVKKFTNSALHWGHLVREHLQLTNEYVRTGVKRPMAIMIGDFRPSMVAAEWKNRKFAHGTDGVMQLVSDAELLAMFRLKYEQANEECVLQDLKQWFTSVVVPP